jgi:hypothetical protein
MGCISSCSRGDLSGWIKRQVFIPEEEEMMNQFNFTAQVFRLLDQWGVQSLGAAAQTHESLHYRNQNGKFTHNKYVISPLFCLSILIFSLIYSVFEQQYLPDIKIFQSSLILDQ